MQGLHKRVCPQAHACLTLDICLPAAAGTAGFVGGLRGACDLGT